MTEETSTTLDLSVAETATGLTQTTAESNTMTSSSSRGILYYFECAVVVIGVVGTATNVLILYALVASKQHKKHVLIVNQNALDLFGSFFLIITYSVKLCKISYLSGSTGYWLCTLLLSEGLSWCGLMGSAINLAIVSVERYLKIVHRTWSQKYLRKWVIYSAAAFAWIGSIIYNLAVVFPTTRVIDGVCYPYAFWKNRAVFITYSIYHFMSFYVIILLVFIFCYWRILMVIRHQASVMAGHSTSGGSSTAQTQHSHIQTSVIKTMVFVSILFAITWLPNYLMLTLAMSVNMHFSIYYASMFIAFLYVSINPFIYATKFNPVKEILLRMIPCKKISGQGTQSVAGTGPCT